ncbi:glutamate-cysteine ligase family protein, partial [Streptomyces sp. T-3]|nr:glutamate-cysteine ligase family protein [Streptomyces sp. T-3]
APPPGMEPRAAWTRHVLDAPVMCVRTDDGPWPVPQGLSFREWVRTGRPRPPTRADLDYHLTTLFPPVRPRGHLELRMIDAQPGEDGWLVPLAVVDALFDDPEATERAYRTVKPLAERASCPAPDNPLWRSAARDGLTDPELREAAVECFAAALEALPRRGAPV